MKDDYSTVKEQGGWMRFSTSNRTLVINREISQLLGIPFNKGPVSGWTKKYLNEPVPIARLQSAMSLVEVLKVRNDERYSDEQQMKYIGHSAL